MNTTMTAGRTWRDLASTLGQDGRAFINGQRVDSSTGETRPARSPVDGRVLADLAACTEADVDRAVAAAREAFGGWSGESAEHRKKVLLRLADLMERHADELSLRETLDIGKAIAQTTTVDIPGSIETFRWYAEAADKVAGELPATPRGATALVTREPLGVVGAIVPWNYPLEIASWKLAPALAAGNTVVLKPAEASSMTALRLAEIAVEAGLPAGVLNVVTGSGRVVGNAIARHMGVDALAFTGSTEVSRTLMEASARSNLKRLALEAGGKSANIVFADTADLQAAAAQAAFTGFYNQGQVCSANSRILVQRPVLEAFTEALVAAAQSHRPGDPLDGDHAGNGSLVSVEHTDAVASWIERGRQEGDILAGGSRPTINGSTAYLEPTVVGGLSAGSALHSEEIFGPVVALQPFDTEEEAVALANGTRYGLAASLWTSDVARVHRVSRALVAGTVSVNTVDALSLTTPFGGFKQSGFGRDLSLHAFENYTDLKTTWVQWG